MNRNDDFFTPEHVDEQIEGLSQLDGQLTNYLDKGQPQSGHAHAGDRLVYDLRRFYTSNSEEDAHSLERAWDRISGASMHAPSDLDGREQPLDILRFQQERLKPMNTHPSDSSRKNTFLQHLGMIAAVLFLTLLIGSMLAVFNNAHQSHLSGHATSVTASQNAQLNIYVSNSKIVYKLDSKTGKVLWHFSAADPVVTPPTVMNGTAYFVAPGSYLYAVNTADGSLRWKYKTADTGSFSPAVADGLVYMDTSDGYLVALDAANGNVRWKYKAGAAVNSLVTVVNDVVYGLAFDDPQSLNSTLFALNAKNGSQLWRKPESTYFYIKLQVVNGVIYAVSTIDDKASNPPNRYSYVFAFDAKSGTQIWRSAIIHEYVPSPPTMVNGVLYLASDELGLEGPHVYALNASNGSVIWQKAVPGPVNSSPQVVDGLVYIGQTSNSSNGNNNIIALNAADGSRRWTHPLPNYMDFGNPLIVNNGSIYVATLDGIIHVLRMSNGSQSRTYTFGSEDSLLFQPALTLAP